MRDPVRQHTRWSPQALVAYDALSVAASFTLTSLCWVDPSTSYEFDFEWVPDLSLVRYTLV